MDERFFIQCNTGTARSALTEWLSARGHFPYSVTGLEVEVPSRDVQQRALVMFDVAEGRKS